jgi:hypothetical protein
MKKCITSIAILLTLAICLPTFAACDIGGYKPQQNQNGVEDKDETKAPVNEDANEALIDGLELVLDGDAYRVADYKGKSENVVIPAESSL